jgi:nucleotide-binding universal stress UspA family protein
LTAGGGAAMICCRCGRGQRRRAEGRTEAGMVQIKKVLYATDFSEFSQCALPYALDVCQRHGAELHCVHVLDEVQQYWLDASDGVAVAMLPLEEIRQATEKQLNAWAAQHLQGVGERWVAKLLEGRPFVQIIRYAREQEIDLIVMASHGHGALAAALLGSVAEKVVRKAPCPVLTVRVPGHKFEMP